MECYERIIDRKKMRQPQFLHVNSLKIFAILFFSVQGNNQKCTHIEFVVRKI